MEGTTQEEKLRSECIDMLRRQREEEQVLYNKYKRKYNGIMGLDGPDDYQAVLKKLHKRHWEEFKAFQQKLKELGFEDLRLS